MFLDSVLLSGKGAELILLGRKGGDVELDLERVAKSLAERPEVASDLERIHLGTLTQISGMFVSDSKALSSATERSMPVTDDRPTVEYSVTSRFYLYSRIPEEMIDESRITAWCPNCCIDRHSESRVPRLGEYLAVMSSFYTSPAFLEFRNYGPQKGRPVIVPNGVTANVVRENSFLQAYFRIDPDQLPEASTSPTLDFSSVCSGANRVVEPLRKTRLE